VRALAALVLMSGCGSRPDPWACKDKAAELEARMKREQADADAMGRVTDLFGYPQSEAIAELPLSTEGKHPFTPGFAIWTDTTPEAFERVIAARGCTKKPLVIYLVPHTPDALAASIGEQAAWIRAASTRWGVELEPRLVVRLPEARDYNPWPPEATDEVKAWAKAVLAIEGEERWEKLKARSRAAIDGCSAIGERMASGVDEGGSTEAILGVPRGLSDCGCLGVDYDELVGVFHLLNLIRTEVAWTPANATSTMRAIPPLACDAHEPIAMRRIDSWEGPPPPNLEEMIAQLASDIAPCLQRSPIEEAGLYTLDVRTTELSNHKRLEGELHARDGRRGFSDFDRCVRSEVELETPATGSTRIDFYVPGGL
jgi:hypothetical protein